MDLLFVAVFSLFLNLFTCVCLCLCASLFSLSDVISIQRNIGHLKRQLRRRGREAVDLPESSVGREGQGICTP